VSVRGRVLLANRGLIACCPAIEFLIHRLTGERKIKKTKTGERSYVYYRCARYTSAGHPRTRTTEPELDRQVLELFDRIKIQDPKVRK
jgi:hypothetical protein